MSDAYTAAGVDTGRADRAVAAIVDVLRTIEPGRARRAIELPAHFASVLRVGPNLGIAFGTDSVGSKVIVAEQAARFDTIGVDCVAMCVNDLICVGAEPLAVLDYVAVEQADPRIMAELADGLRIGAQAAGVEIPGGEVCQVPELLRGHPSPLGLDLVGSALGTVALDRIVDGGACRPGDALIGLRSSGVHANGLTLARRALLDDGGLGLEARPPELGGASVEDTLLEPTTIYVRGVLALLRSGVDVHGLVHITGGGLLNLLRIGVGIGYRIEAPLPVPGVFALIARLGRVSVAEMWQVFNMGCGFVVIVAAEQAQEALRTLSTYHPGSAVIGTVTAHSGRVEVPSMSIEGDPDGLRESGGQAVADGTP